MIELNQSKFKFPARPYQLKGVKTLLSKKVYGLFWEMRLGKSKVVVDTACTLFDNDEIGVVIVVCPAQVKEVWTDKELGQVKVHGWDANVFDYNSATEDHLDFFKGFLKCTRTFIVTSFEFLRQQDAQGEFPKVSALLKSLAGLATWLVIDEGAAIGNDASLQTKAVYRMRGGADRVTILDGTPIGNSPVEQFSKFKALDPKILGYKNFHHFRAIHGVIQKSKFTRFGKLVGFKGQNVIDQKVASHCEYLSQDGLDLPEKIPSFITVYLTPKTWRTYCQMRSEMIAELERGTLEVQHAAVKSLRLAQICSGFLGGFDGELGVKETAELSDESTDALIVWIKARLHERPDFRCVVWCRWRAEIERLYKRLQEFTNVGVRYGGDKTTNFLHPDYDLAGPGIMIAQPGAAKYGVNFSKADTEAFLSQDYDRIARSQSEERIQGVGIRKSSLILDVRIKGPKGQRTIVDDIHQVLQGKSEIAMRTVSAWKKALED